MLVWEAHLALADALGDSTRIDSQNINDGARYSKSLRDSYLYRAMLSVLNKRILQLKGLTNTQLYNIIHRFFPSSIQVLRCTLDNLPLNTESLWIQADGRYARFNFNDKSNAAQPEPLLIIGGRLRDTASINNRSLMPMPIKSPIEASGLLNSLSIQDHDAFMLVHYRWVQGMPDAFRPEIEIYSSHIDLSNDSEVEIQIEYIAKPIDPSTQLPTDTLLIDEMFIPEIINQAITYALVDSQDIEISPAYSQFNQEIDKLMLNIPQGG